MEQIPVPAGLLAYLLLIPLRGQETRQKQAGIPHRGRSNQENEPLRSKYTANQSRLNRINSNPQQFQSLIRTTF